MVSALGTEHSSSQLAGEHLSVYGTKQVKKIVKKELMSSVHGKQSLYLNFSDPENKGKENQKRPC